MADDEVVQVKSCAGQHSPVVGGGHEVGGGVSGELVRPGKRREKEGGATTMTILNRHTEVGDCRQGGASWWARTKRGREGGGSRPTG
jgi:hypothetical protein